MGGGGGLRKNPFRGGSEEIFWNYTMNRVRTGPGKPGKSWNFIMAFSRTGKSWKKATGPGKLWKFVKRS